MYRHHAMPTPGSMIRDGDRQPVDGNTPADYPLLARCKSCNREIRIEAAVGSGWMHAKPSSARDHADEIEKLTEVADLYGNMVQRLQRRTPQASGHNPGTL